MIAPCVFGSDGGVQSCHLRLLVVVAVAINLSVHSGVCVPSGMQSVPAGEKLYLE